jgi:hypothetical protein
VNQTGGGERRGFVAFPRAWREFAREHLTPAQRALLDDLAEAACWEPSTVRVHRLGFETRLDVGEVLVSSRDLEKSSGLDRDQVRRALDRCEALGLISRRPAAPCEPTPQVVPGSAPQPAPRPAPPPTVVRVLKYRDIFWPSKEAAPPPAPLAAPEVAPRPAPIQHGYTTPETTTPIAAARGARAGGAPEGTGSPARKAARPPDDLPVRRLAVEDYDELGPLGSEFRARIEAELGHGIAVASAGDEPRVRDELEALLGLPWVGVDRAVEWVVSTARVRRKRPGGEPGSVAWCLKVLETMRDQRPAAARAPERPAGCPDWARIRTAIRGQVLPRIYDRWWADLDGLRVGDALEVYAPDAFHRDFVEDNYGAWLQELADELLPEPLKVRLEVVEQPPLAAGAGPRG